ncbi:MAG: malate/lactate/ureidoglycolate dehydrogenase [Planctomycetaceae bacterium]|nr:malate/lactate/ureidoglycolate dehydrogenase [Planctomycetaceae bacterium]|tara:strand:+ start:9583 stop:10629 length:1047 start_codon:yes stop_codon:yes gene_type:complete
MIFQAELLIDLTRRIFQAVGSNDAEAEVVAQRLVNANLSGHDSHGVIRIPTYINWIREDKTLLNQTIDIETDNGSMVVVDGKFGLGQSIGQQAMQLGIERAGEHGVAVIALKDSAHLGRIGDWPEMCAEAGMVSVHFVNTSGMGNLVAPYGAIERRLSANPFAAGVPTQSEFPLILDMSACTIAEGKIRVALHAGKQVPEGCIIDSEGKPTTDPKTFYGPPAGSILPIAGHKGYALSMIIEMMAGALTGGSCTNPERANRLSNGMLSIIMDRSKLQTEDYFYNEVERYCNYVRSAKLMDENNRILMPGEIEYNTRATRRVEGIELSQTTIEMIQDTCNTLGIESGLPV